MDEEGELHQYVIYEQAKSKGPKVIKLDNPKAKNSEVENYTPPTSLTVHLSKIDMPELKPRAASQPPDKNIMKDWDKKEKEKGKGKEKEKPAKKDKRREDEKKQKPSPSPPPGKLTKPPGSSSKPGRTTPPSIPHHSRPPPDTWAQYPSPYNQPVYQHQFNTATPPPPPPQPGSMVSNLMGRLDRFTKR